MSNHHCAAIAHLRSHIPATTNIITATLTMEDVTNITMAIGGDEAAFWAAASDYCDRNYDDQRPFDGGTLWLSDDSWIEHQHDNHGDGELCWVRRSRPVIPPELQKGDRFCGCGCGRKLTDGNRSGYAAKCYTKCPDVRSRLAANRKAVRAKVRKGAIG